MNDFRTSLESLYIGSTGTKGVKNVQRYQATRLITPIALRASVCIMLGAVSMIFSISYAKHCLNILKDNEAIQGVMRSSVLSLLWVLLAVLLLFLAFAFIGDYLDERASVEDRLKVAMMQGMYFKK